MKLNILTTAALLAITGALMTQSAKAQFPSTDAANGDLILSFSEANTGNSGNTTNYEIDLGKASTYTGASSTVDIGNIVADLNADYGTGWTTDSQLSMGIIGGLNVSTTNRSIWASDTSTSPFAAENGSSLGSQISGVAKLYTPTSGSPLPTDGSATGSYNVPTPDNGYSFNQVFSGIASEVPRLDATLGSTPELYLDSIHATSTFTAGTSTIALNGPLSDPGYFTIATSGPKLGELYYVVQQAEVVPEPSTYALMILGGALLFVWQARRKSVSSH